MKKDPAGGSYRLVIYDLDGTLVDTREDIVNATQQMRRQMGLEPLEESLICGYVGSGLPGLVGRCLGTEDSQQIKTGIQLYRAYYQEHMLDHTRLYPGAQNLLDHFNDRIQVLITNKPNPYSEEILKALGVTGHFHSIIAGDSQFPRKPDPAAVLAILETEQIQPQEALFIGDSPIDVETGRRAQVTTIGVTHGFSSLADLETAGPDHMVSDLKELLALAIQENW